MSIRMRLDPDARLPTFPVEGALQRAAEALLGSLRRVAPEKTGALRRSFRFGLLGRRVEFRSAIHGMWLTQGTGLWGPNRAPIRPKRARVLHFFAYGREWFLPSVRGIDPKKHDFRGRAVEEAQEPMREAVERAAREWFGKVLAS
ncbi:MAG: hypothetical protein QJR03_12175 [Sphaerobacter sp.]|nr:hypothetical protein [Sphaerobacter sp.]